MIELFRSRNSEVVGHLQGLLESEGIPTFYRNENLSTTGLPIAEFTPVLCVTNESDVERAIRIIRGYVESSTVDSPVEQCCPECGETSPGNFATCWKCGSPLPA